ncbi:MAG: 4-hydroxy-3-methylbut-2-enyl diphosphate reductase [Candidatus Cloacimonetes bacterium]|nr:4-hydroxy-3-methylbut-2-enyl diphosphate reductase [Candidatus Cloacimonadota bacterium]
MTVKLAKNSGFCFGVKRAINMAEEASAKYSEIVTLGPIIHNPQMVERLKEKGIIPIESIDDVDLKPVIIRSHGITKELREKLDSCGLLIIDATCPYVASSQQYVTQLSNEGFPIIIVGNKDHPEVIALKSYVNGEAYIVLNPADIPKKRFNKLAVISQTTQSIENLQSIVNTLIPFTKELRLINTICNATSVRQDSTFLLAQESDLMIVIGGKNSSNTRMLYQICQNIVETFLIETSEEFDCSWLEKKVNIGLTAGASTPDWIIVEVYNKIMKCLGNHKHLIDCVEKISGYKEE